MAESKFLYIRAFNRIVNVDDIRAVICYDPKNPGSIKVVTGDKDIYTSYPEDIEDIKRVLGLDFLVGQHEANKTQLESFGEK